MTTILPTALVLDGNQRSALATTRSLGAAGVPVTVAEETAASLAGSSRFARESFVYPSPARMPEAFLDTLEREVRSRRIGVLLPMTEVTVSLLVRERERFAPAVLPFASAEVWDSVADKCALFRLAGRRDVPVPATLFPSSPDEIAGCAEQLGYPVVLKPCRSKIWSGGRCVATSVHVVRAPDELRPLLAARSYLRDFPVAVQTWVPGSGQGVFAVYDRGRPLAFFAHRRLREKPPAGGVSVLSESAPPPTALRAHAERLLGGVHWHGVAMVEFRVTPDGTPYLMEINPRFWGSLQLAIDAGVDFPQLLYRIANGESPAAPPPYRVGVRLRWLLGDLDRLYLVLRAHGPPDARLSRTRELLRFLRLWDRNTRYETNRLGDLGPFWFELRQYLAHLLR